MNFAFLTFSHFTMIRSVIGGANATVILLPVLRACKVFVFGASVLLIRSNLCMLIGILLWL